MCGFSLGGKYSVEGHVRTHHAGAGAYRAYSVALSPAYSEYILIVYSQPAKYEADNPGKKLLEITQ